MKNNTKIIAVIGMAILALVFIEWRYQILFPEEQKESNAQASNTSSSETKLPVQSVIIRKQVLNNIIRVNGSILPDESIVLRPEVSGRVTGIFFNEGQRVKKGQLLLTINDEELKAQLNRAKSTKKLLEETEYRQKRLLERDAISKEEYDVALTELNQAQADISLLEAQLDKMKIIAPFDGIIGLRNVSLGGYITPSDQLASLYNINPVKIEFSIPAKYASRVNVGNTINFTVDGVDQEFKGKLYALEPQVDLSTRTLKMRALASNDNAILLPGLFANIKLTLDTKENAILVPSEAIVPELQGHKVYVSQNGQAGVRKVNLGIRTETEVEITSGLQEGDTVLTSGILQLREGTAIRTILKN